MEHFNNIDSENYSNAVSGADVGNIAQGVGNIFNTFKKSDAQKDVKASCGSKPFGFGKKHRAKKAKYDECVAGLRNPSPQSAPANNTPPPPPPLEKSNTALYVGITVGVLLITTLIIFRKRIF